MKIKQFEVPYNFDEVLIPFYQQQKEYINFIFLPPFREDLRNTRTIVEGCTKGLCYMPSSRSEYEYHLLSIHNAGLKIVLLWQVPDSILTINNLDYYTSLGVDGFIIANDKNASIIKNYNNNLLVIASIVQRICDNISRRDFTLYDYVVMFYPFNRSLKCVEILSNKNLKGKMIIMPNTVCHTDCPAIHHWFPSTDHPFVQDRDCFAMRNISKCCFIYPEHLYLFDDFVAGYKLQGREYPTDIIIDVCTSYFKRISSDGLLEPNIDNVLKQNQRKIPLREYYNTKTSEIIELI
jgi:hypothetical protein